MNHIDRKGWMKWFLTVVIFFSGCGPPITTRLVTIELQKPPEAEVQSIKTIGVIPFSSPALDVGRKMTADIARALDRGVLSGGPFVARTIKPPEDFVPVAEAINKLGQKVQVDAFILGEISQFSVQTSRTHQPMLSKPEFGSGDPAQYEWLKILEDASIQDTFYYRIFFICLS